MDSRARTRACMLIAVSANTADLFMQATEDIQNVVLVGVSVRWMQPHGCSYSIFSRD